MRLEVSLNSTQVPLHQTVSSSHCSQTQTNQDCSVTVLTQETKASLVRSWCKGKPEPIGLRQQGTLGSKAQNA